MKFFRRIWLWICGYSYIDVHITAGSGAGQSRRCWQKGINVILESPWDTQPSANSVFEAKTKIGAIRAMKIFDFLRRE